MSDQIDWIPLSVFIFFFALVTVLEVRPRQRTP